MEWNVLQGLLNILRGLKTVPNRKGFNQVTSFHRYSTPVASAAREPASEKSV
jgi:hypothetical protein